MDFSLKSITLDTLARSFSNEQAEYLISKLEERYQKEEISYVVGMKKYDGSIDANIFILDLFLECHELLNSIHSDLYLIYRIFNNELFTSVPRIRELRSKLNQEKSFKDKKYVIKDMQEFGYLFYNLVNIDEIYNPEESKIMIGFLQNHPEYEKYFQIETVHRKMHIVIYRDINNDTYTIEEYNHVDLINDQMDVDELQRIIYIP